MSSLEMLSSSAVQRLESEPDSSPERDSEESSAGVCAAAQADALSSLLKAHELLEKTGGAMRPRRPPRCTRCHEPGHYRNHCPLADADGTGDQAQENPRSSWTPDEDASLRKLVDEMGTRRWCEIAKHMPGRKGKQCRERWVNHLTVKTKKGVWTAKEDAILMRSVREVGTKWTVIANFLPGRAENTIKNRYYASLRKEQRRVARNFAGLGLASASAQALAALGNVCSHPAPTGSGEESQL